LCSLFQTTKLLILSKLSEEFGSLLAFKLVWAHLFHVLETKVPVTKLDRCSVFWRMKLCSFSKSKSAVTAQEAVLGQLAFQTMGFLKIYQMLTKPRCACNTPLTCLRGCCTFPVWEARGEMFWCGLSHTKTF